VATKAQFTEMAKSTFGAAVADLHKIPSNQVFITDAVAVPGTSPALLRVMMSITDNFVSSSTAVVPKFQSVVEHNNYTIAGYSVKHVRKCCTNVSPGESAWVQLDIVATLAGFNSSEQSGFLAAVATLHKLPTENVVFPMTPGFVAVPGSNQLRLTLSITDYYVDSSTIIVSKLQGLVMHNNNTIKKYPIVAVRECCTSVGTGYQSSVELDIVSTLGAFDWSAQNTFMSNVATLFALPAENVALDDAYAVSAVPGSGRVRFALKVRDYYVASYTAVVPKMQSVMEKNKFKVGNVSVAAVRECCTSSITSYMATVEIDLAGWTVADFTPQKFVFTTALAALLQTTQNIAYNPWTGVAAVPGSSNVRLHLDITATAVPSANAIVTKVASLVAQNGNTIGTTPSFSVAAVRECCSAVFTGYVSSVEFDIVGELATIDTDTIRSSVASMLNLLTVNVILDMAHPPATVLGTSDVRVTLRITDTLAANDKAVITRFSSAVEKNSNKIGPYVVVEVRACCTPVFQGYVGGAEVDVESSLADFDDAARLAFGSALATLYSLPAGNVLVGNASAIAGSATSVRVPLHITDYRTDSPQATVPKLQKAVHDHSGIVGAYKVLTVRECCSANGNSTTTFAEVDILSSADAFTASHQCAFASAVAALHNIAADSVAISSVGTILGTDGLRLKLSIVDPNAASPTALLALQTAVGGYQLKAVRSCCTPISIGQLGQVEVDIQASPETFPPSAQRTFTAAVATLFSLPSPNVAINPTVHLAPVPGTSNMRVTLRIRDYHVDNDKLIVTKLQSLVEKNSFVVGGLTVKTVMDCCTTISAGLTAEVQIDIAATWATFPASKQDSFAAAVAAFHGVPESNVYFDTSFGTAGVAALLGTPNLRVALYIVDPFVDSDKSIVTKLQYAVESHDNTIAGFPVVAVMECCDNVFTGYQSSAEVDITSPLDAFHVGTQQTFAADVAALRKLPQANVAVANVLAIPGTSTLRVQLQITDYNVDSKLAIVPQLASAVETTTSR